jgi:large subunit ribosomal protein L5
MSLKSKYNKEIVPKMMEKYSLKSNMAVPRVEKVVLNVGLGPALKDSKYSETIYGTIKKISGQAPQKTYSKRAISGFGIREDQNIGLKVTLRGDNMYEFLYKLINVVLPRVRDFKGLNPKSFDGKGNYSLGFKEHTVFPEVRTDEVERT